MNALFKHMNMKNYIISFFTAAVMSLAASHAASAQSQGFKLGQWSEIQNSIIKELNKQGTTILLVEQNANKALEISDRAYVLETGSITLSGTGAELASSDEVRKAYLGG